jgi:hypothetical protein
MGIKCDKCAPGFTGPQCDQCLPNHFGLHCVPCQCEHGVCVVYGDGPDHVVRCECDPNWFGSTCDISLQLGSNLILDPNFESLRSKEPAVGLWHLYKDGYELFILLSYTPFRKKQLTFVGVLGGQITECG